MPQPLQSGIVIEPKPFAGGKLDDGVVGTDAIAFIALEAVAARQVGFDGLQLAGGLPIVRCDEQGFEPVNRQLTDYSNKRLVLEGLRRISR
jgi:hypothetical protein